MASHPVNLTLRFILELAALAATGAWGWKQGEGVWSYVLAIGIPIVLAAVWSVFAVPQDPSRSGGAPVVTRGLVRLLIELSFFTFAVWALYDMGSNWMSMAMGIAVLLHYALSYDRIAWLISH